MSEISKTSKDKELVPKLTKEQYDLLLYLEQSYWRTSSLPSYEAIKARGIELDEEVYNTAWINPRFVNSLRGRGVPEHLLQVTTGVGAFGGHVLTEQQMTVANILMDVLDKRSRLKKLTELGISTQEYNTWLRDPVYRQYCLERSESILLDAQPVAHLSLIERVNQGDLGAIKYFNSMTGRYRERQSAGVEVNVQNNYGMDAVIQIVEIIQKHIKDPELLSAIGEDILKLQNQQNQQQYPTKQNMIEGKVEKVETYGI